LQKPTRSRGAVAVKRRGICVGSLLPTRKRGKKKGTLLKKMKKGKKHELNGSILCRETMFDCTKKPRRGSSVLGKEQKRKKEIFGRFRRKEKRSAVAKKGKKCRPKKKGGLRPRGMQAGKGKRDRGDAGKKIEWKRVGPIARGGNTPTSKRKTWEKKSCAEGKRPGSHVVEEAHLQIEKNPPEQGKKKKRAHEGPPSGRPNSAWKNRKKKALQGSGLTLKELLPLDGSKFLLTKKKESL